MKLNINNWTLTCEEQPFTCDNCLFRGKSACTSRYPMLNTICIELDIIFVKETSSNLFNL